MNEMFCREFKVSKDYLYDYIEVVFAGAAKLYFNEVEKLYEKCRVVADTTAEFSGLQCLGKIIRRNELGDPMAYTGKYLLISDPELLEDCFKLISERERIQRDIQLVRMWLTKVIRKPSNLQDCKDNLPDVLANSVPALRSVTRTKEFNIPEKEKNSYEKVLQILNLYLGLRIIV